MGRPVFASLLLLATSSISAAGQTTILDSAGVSIIQAGRFAAQPEWTLASGPPLLEVGQLDGDDPYLFGSVWDATRFDDGTIAITDGQTYEIRLFDSSGRHVRTFGGRGEGPAEFSGPPWLRTVGTELLAWDAGALRLTRFDGEGQIISQLTPRDEMFEVGVGRFPNGPVWDLGEHGALLWSGPFRGGSRPTEGVQDQFLTLVSKDAEGVIHSHGNYPETRVIFKDSEGVGMRGMGDMFSPRTNAALALDGSIIVADPVHWELKQLTPSGELSAIVRGEPPRMRISRAVVSAERAKLDDMAYRLGVPLRDVEEMFDQLEPPGILPAIGDLLVDRVGRVWVGRRRTSYPMPVYDVLSQEGAYLGTADVGEITKILEVGQDYILVSASDEYDVNYLRMYSLPDLGR